MVQEVVVGMKGVVSVRVKGDPISACRVEIFQDVDGRLVVLVGRRLMVGRDEREGRGDVRAGACRHLGTLWCGV